MKVRLYLRVAQGPRGPRAKVNVNESHAPITTGAWNDQVLPTVAFSVDFVIPDELFETPSIGEVKIPAERAKILVEGGEE